MILILSITFVILFALALCACAGKVARKEREHFMCFPWKESFNDAGVPAEEQSKCMAWAFGDDWLTLPINESYERWNERHKNIFIMCAYDNVQGALIRVGRAYMRHADR